MNIHIIVTGVIDCDFCFTPPLRFGSWSIGTVSFSNQVRTELSEDSGRAVASLPSG